MSHRRRRLVQKDDVHLLGAERAGRVGEEAQAEGEAPVEIQPLGMDDRDVDVGESTGLAPRTRSDQEACDDLRARERVGKSPGGGVVQIGDAGSLVDQGHRVAVRREPGSSVEATIRTKNRWPGCCARVAAGKRAGKAKVVRRDDGAGGASPGFRRGNGHGLPSPALIWQEYKRVRRAQPRPIRPSSALKDRFTQHTQQILPVAALMDLLGQRAQFGRPKSSRDDS